jgi:beta-phosphoglucomutase-like phosphatase (HAD superfamily)
VNKVQAVVFDMDGVLVESEEVWRELREEFAASIGQTWTAADQTSKGPVQTARVAAGEEPLALPRAGRRMRPAAAALPAASAQPAADTA